MRRDSLNLFQRLLMVIYLIVWYITTYLYDVRTFSMVDILLIILHLIYIGLFDIKNKKWSFWMKNPQGCDPLFSIPLNFDWDNTIYNIDFKNEAKTELV